MLCPLLSWLHTELTLNNKQYKQLLYLRGDYEILSVYLLFMLFIIYNVFYLCSLLLILSFGYRLPQKLLWFLTNSICQIDHKAFKTWLQVVYSSFSQSSLFNDRNCLFFVTKLGLTTLYLLHYCNITNPIITLWLQLTKTKAI